MPVPNARFIFHNAGQGLFYSGNVDNFELIYDCGSRRSDHCNKLVSNYKSRIISKGNVDLLVLSHFHDDHISGLQSLLVSEPKLSIGLAIIPYLSPLERLIVSLSSNNMGEWYYRFLSDPVKYLLDHGVERVIVLDGSRPSPAEQPDFDNPEQPDWIENEHYQAKIIASNSPTLKENLKKENAQLLQYFDKRRILAKQNKGALYLHTHALDWLFRFYNCQIKDQKKLQEFENCIKPIVIGQSITEVISSTSKRKHLKECYKLLNTDLNDTSILLFHVPVCKGQDTMPFENQGHLLTGDIDLNQRLNEICNYFNQDLTKVANCLVPHHGSKNNWNKAFLNWLPPECRWIVSSSIANSKHPHDGVVNDIVSNHSALIHCTETVGMISEPLFSSAFVYINY